MPTASRTSTTVDVMFLRTESAVWCALFTESWTKVTPRSARALTCSGTSTFGKSTFGNSTAGISNFGRSIFGSSNFGTSNFGISMFGSANLDAEGVELALDVGSVTSGVFAAFVDVVVFFLALPAVVDFSADFTFADG